VTVQRVVGGVEVEHDLLRRSVVGIEEQLDEQRLDRLAVMGDPAVAVCPGGAVLQAVERALAGERRAAAVARLQPAEHHPEHRIVAQPVVVDHVLVAERDAEHPLPDQRRHRMDHPLRPVPVGPPSARDVAITASEMERFEDEHGLLRNRWREPRTDPGGRQQLGQHRLPRDDRIIGAGVDVASGAMIAI
jgi:xanthine/CO dehydrogenase XdhC/CoxF family maturation factor